MIRLICAMAAMLAAGGAMATDVTPVPPAVAAAAPVAADPAAAAAQKHKTEIVCHSSIETGSLVKRNKVCLTRKQWSYVNDINHDQAQRLADDNRTKGSSN